MFKTDFNADESRLAKGRKGRKAWPADCLWPEPVWDGTHGGMQWSAEPMYPESPKMQGTDQRTMN